MAKTSKAGNRKKTKSRKPKALSKPQKAQVQKMVLGEAEKKTVYHYNSFNDGTVTTRATGAYVNRGWAIQNQGIRTNNTDILQLIPYCDEGTDVNQRIGRKIDPVKLSLAGSVRVSLARLNGSPTLLTNLKVYLFIVQHVQIKDYYTLYGQNDFSQFLYNGEGKTVYFDGEEQNTAQQVNSSVYKILKRVCIPLKFAGNPSGSTVGIPNSHVWKANYQLDLTKYLPAKLLYPLNTVGGPLPPEQAGAPTNSSIFMCMGFTSDINPSNTNGTEFTGLPWIEQTYVTRMHYTDS